MTCQLAQILGPIRAASAPVPSPEAAPAADQPLDTALPIIVTTSDAAAASVDPDWEASLEAAADAFLAQIGIDCRSELSVRANSGAQSEFELVSRAASDAQSALTKQNSRFEQHLGPKVNLSRSASAAVESSQSFDCDIFAAPVQSRRVPSMLIDYSDAFDDFMSDCSGSSEGSICSLVDIAVDMGRDSGMTVNDDAANGPATCVVMTDNGTGMSGDEVLRWAKLTSAPDSIAESADDCGSEVCMVSAHSFEDDSTDDESQADAGGDEWEML